MWSGRGLTLWAKEGAALSTEEVFGMPGLLQCRHHFLNTHTHTQKEEVREGKGHQRTELARLHTYIQDGSAAVEAARREELLVVVLAVRQTVTLKEVPGADVLLAVAAHKVFWVPGLAQGRHHLHTHTQWVRRQGGGALPPASW